MDRQTVLAFDAISEDHHRSFAAPSAHIDDFLRYLPSASFVLNAGCGLGTDAAYMHSFNHLVIGVDFSEQMILFAKQKSEDIPFVCKDLRLLDFNSNFFDGVLASSSLTHLPKEDIKNCLYNFSRMLHAGGILYLCLLEGTPGRIRPSAFCDHQQRLILTLFSLPEITQFLHETGFRVLSHFHTEPTFPSSFDLKRMCIIAQRFF